MDHLLATFRRLVAETVSMSYKAIGAAVITELTNLLHHLWSNVP